VFADHSLATDSVFGEMHVISCRNVLIYFDHALQERALRLMADSLCRRGFLGLGNRETLQFSEQQAAFTEVVPLQRWYQKC
jgi:chemotaxis protein methyltransferase CheR